MAIFNLEQLRQSAPQQFKDYSDEALVVEYSNATGQDPFEVAEYFGVQTGRGKSVSAGFSSGIDMVQGLGLSAAAAGAAALGARDTEEYLAGLAKQQQYEGMLAGNPELERVEDLTLGNVLPYIGYNVAKQGPMVAGLTVATLANPLLGATAGYGVGVGSLYESAREADGYVSGEDLLEIGGKSIPYALLETITPLAFAKMFRTGAGFTGGVATRTAKGAGMGVASEASTELGQTELEISMNPNLTEEEKQSMRLNAAVAGGVVGGGLGGAGGALRKYNPASEGADLTQPPRVKREPVAEQPTGPTITDTNELRQAELDIPAGEVYETDPETGIQPESTVEEAPTQFDNEDQFAFDFVTDEEARIRAISNVENRFEELREQVKQSRNVPARRAKMAVQRIGAVNEQIAAVDARIAEIEADENKTTGNPIKPVYRKEYRNLQQQRQQLEAEVNRWSKDASKINVAMEMAALSTALDAINNGVAITDLDQNQLAAVRTAIPEEVAYLEQRQQLKEATDLTQPMAQPVADTQEDVAEQLGLDIEAQQTPEAQATEEAVVTEEALATEETTATPPTEPTAQAEAVVDEDSLFDAAVANVERENDNLKAEVTSQTREPVGRPDINKGIFSAVMRMIRSADYTPDPIIYKYDQKGKQTLTVDADRPLQDYATARSIYNALMKVASTKKKLDDVSKNVFYGNEVRYDSDGKPQPVKRKISTLQENERQAADYQKTLLASVQNFVNAAGGKANAQAIVAAIKQIRDLKYTYPNIADKLEDYNVEFNKTDPAKARPFKTMGEVLATIDVSLSSAFAAYRDGDLTGEYDTVSPRDIRFSTKRKKTAEKTKLQEIYDDAGLDGILDFISARKGTRSTYVIVLASAIKYAIRNMASVGEAPKIQFIKEGNPYYDRGENTIYIREESSEEEILHETLHAATAWYVQQNPNSEAVAELRDTLDKVLNTATPAFVKGLEMTDASKKRINDVLNILRTLKASENPDDAILELMAYGTTLRDFKAMLKEIDQPETKQMRTWKNLIETVWQQIANLTAAFLGVKNKAANSVLDNTVRILEAASILEEPTRQDFVAGQLNALVFQSRNVDITGKGVERNEQQQNDRQAYVGANVTRMVIENLGVTKAIDVTTDQFKEAASYIRKEMPLLEKTISIFNTRFGVSPALSALMDMWKVIRNTPLTIVNRLITKGFENQSVDRRRAILEYLDGDNVQAIEQYKDSAALKLMADSLLNHYNSFIEQLPDDQQALFAGKKFSDSLLHVASGKDVSNHNLSQRSLTELAKSGLIKVDQADIDNNLNLFQLDQNDNPILDGTLYLATVTDPLSDREYKLVVSKDIVDTEGRDNLPIGHPYVLHDSAPLQLVNFARGKYNFREVRNFKEKLDDNNVEKLTVAMLNTMAALSNFSASRAFLQGLANYDGEPVVYDNIEQVRARHQNPNIQITEASELKSPAIKAKTRSSQHWIKVSDNESMWGPLAGKVIHAPVWHAMNDMSDRSPLVNMRWVNQAMTFFKTTKTTQNPGTHITNVASNITLAIMHGIPMKTVAKAAKLLWEFEVHPERFKDPARANELVIIQDFYESGAMLGTFSSVEIKNVLHQSQVDALKEGESDTIEGKVRHMLTAEMNKSKFAKRLKGWWTNYNEFTIQLYAAEDNAFRLAAYMNKLDELGGEPTVENRAAAGRAALKMFLDYDIDSPAVKAARQSVFPFISWTYAAMPLIGRIAVEKPWQIANVMLAYTMLDLVASGLAGDDDELRKFGPERLDERTFGLRTHIRIPFIGDENNPYYYKLGDYIPLVSTFASTPTGFLGFEGWPQGFKPGGPLVDGLTILMTGLNPYTGKSLYESTDPGIAKFGQIFEGLTDMFVPPWLQSYSRDQVKDAITGDFDIVGNEASLAKALASRVMGLKVVDYNRAEEAAFRQIRESAIGREYKASIRKLQREEMRKGNPDYETMYAEIQDLELRMLEEVRKIYKIEE